MKIPVVAHKSESGFAVYCPSLPGCVSQGETKEEALDNIKDAIRMYFETVEIVEAEKEHGEELEMVEFA